MESPSISKRLFWFLLRYLKTHTTRVFIWYRLVLGVVMVGLLWSGWLKA